MGEEETRKEGRIGEVALVGECKSIVENGSAWKGSRSMLVSMKIPGGFPLRPLFCMLRGGWELHTTNDDGCS